MDVMEPGEIDFSRLQMSDLASIQIQMRMLIYYASYLQTVLLNKSLE